MSRLARQLLIAVAAGAVLGCSSVPMQSPAASPSAIPTSRTSVLAPTPNASALLVLGGYLWTRIDTQLASVAMEAVTVARDDHYVGLGDWLTSTSPDGSPRHPTVWASPDGLAWTREADSTAFVSKRARWEEGVRALIETPGGFVAVGAHSFEDASQADAAAWFSVDGVTWARATVSDGIGRTMDEVVATTDGLVALGESVYSFHGGFGGGTAIWTSTDGRAWTRVADKLGPPPGTRLQDIVSRPGGFLATATFEEGEGLPDTPRPPVTSGIWTSDDGIRWAPISGTPLGLRDLIQTDQGYLAAGSIATDQVARPIVLRSSDGRTWTSASLPQPADLPFGVGIYVDRVVSGPTGFVAFGERDDTYSEIIWSSADALTWRAIDLDTAIKGVVVDSVFAVSDSLLVWGHFDRSGTWEPVAWLLRPER